MRQRPTRSQRRAGTSLLVVLALAGLGGVAYALGGSVVGPHRPIPPSGATATRNVFAHGRAPVLSIRARSSHQTVVAGAAVAYRVRIIRACRLVRSCGHRHRRRAVRISLSVAKPLPAGVTAMFDPRATRSSMATLTVRARRTARPGIYRVRVTARGRVRLDERYAIVRAYTVVGLTVVLPSRGTFTIGGSTVGLLAPGRAAGIDLRLANPNRVPLRIEQLVVRIHGLRAPQANASHPCTVADFAVTQFSGSYRFSLPPSSTSSLSELGFAAGQWPIVSMLDRPVNQDGCKRASIILSFSGTAVGWPR